MIEKKIIGKLPVLLGEYDNAKTYSKKQRVTLYGSEFESKVDNNTTAPATLGNGTLTINTDSWRVVSNGTEAFLAGEKVKYFNEEDNPEFVSADTDNDGKLLESTDIDGNKTIYGNLDIRGNLNNKSLSEQIKKETESKIDKEEGKALIDKNVADNLKIEDNPEYLEVKIDNSGKVISARDSNGVLHENVGIETPHIAIKELEINGEDIKDFLNSDSFTSSIATNLEKVGFGKDHTDFSSKDSLHIPIPLCAYANITGDLPTVKGNTTKGVIDFYDMQGNYFRKYVEIDVHGRTSAVFAKKNYTIDFYNDSDYSESTNIKFGDWVEMDSYYFQGWYTDSFRGIDVIGYQLWQQIINTRGVLKDKPYKYNLYDGIETNTDSDKDVDVNLTSNALCTPMGFPVILYHNGDFLGIYTVMLKKNRDNFLMDKKDYKEIMLDLENGHVVKGNMDWMSFEIRNPKTLICMDGSKYDGDNPKELIDETSESYDASNKDMKNSVQTKNAIKSLASSYNEINSAISEGKTNEEIKTLIERHYNVDYLIDYLIFNNLIDGVDGWDGNWQWTTWDGIKWNPNPYDLNASFGLFPVGNTCNVPNSNMSKSGPCSFVTSYYASEIDTRYRDLVDLGILTSDNIEGLFKAWINRIGSENYEKEFKMWSNTPSQRNSNINSEYWSRETINTSYQIWSDKNTYSLGALVQKVANGDVYKSLQADNKGFDPTASDLWENLTYDSDKEYSVGDIAYMKQWGVMGFKCIKACQGTPPLSKIYNEPYGLCGWHDSLPRVCKWIEKKMEYMNTLFGYTK